MVNNNGLSTPKAFILPVIIAVVLGLVIFWPAGSLKFWQGWIWWAIITFLTFFIAAYFAKKDPALLRRRMKFEEKEPQPGVIRALSFLSILGYLVPGFDFRFQWSTVPVWMVITADVLVFLGYVFIIIVFRENSYASTVIQVEEGQRIIRSGPYALVRHPMYTGLLMIQLFTPLALDSYWALIFSLLFIPVIVQRIIKEEEVLMRELPEYKDYCLQTKYRLIPYIW